MTAFTLRQASWRLALFVLVSLVVLATIAATISPFGSGSSRRTYTAVFTSASRLDPGEDVRVAGVKVGRVQDVDVDRDGNAVVRFDVERSLPVTTSSRLAIRYLDLAGNRYLAVLPGRRDAAPQPPGRPIGTDRTAHALEIKDLLAGFKPLLLGLSPEDVNDLSLEIVQTLQGDGPTIRHLIRRTASLTSGLARRDQLIGSVVHNLDAAVGTLADRHQQLETLLRALRQFADGLAADRRSVGLAIAHIDDMTALSSELLARSRPALRDDVRHLRGVAGTLSSPTGHRLVDHALDHLPDKLARLAATAAYGSWFNYYVCGVRVTVSAEARATSPWLAALLEKVHIVDTAKRCAE